jgi:putative endonuclease
MSGYVYILKSLRNGRFYIGSTQDVEKRFIEHNTGKSEYTSKSCPWELVFKQKFETLTMAKKIEYWIKKQKDREIIYRIIKDGKIIKIL